MPPAEPLPVIAPGWRREALIALNAEAELHRATICTLSISPLAWWRRSTPTAEVGVSERQLAIARGVWVRADAVAESETTRAAEAGARVITRLDDDYPRRLRELALPPPVLYVRGELPRGPALAVVGSRLASTYGRDAVSALAAELAGRGLTVISGFARGIDACAHRAAIEAGGATVAFLGCGIDVDYPSGRRTLRRAVAAHGALASEFPCATPPLPHNFPVRNRLIAALGDGGTLVVEATARSGSLITARLALELGRNVYAVPGRIFDRKAQGPNALIRDGAFLVQHPDDLILALDEAQRQALTAPEPRADPQPPRLPRLQRAILETLPLGERRSLDQLVDGVDGSGPEVQSALLELELGGWIRRHPGPYYRRSDLW